MRASFLCALAVCAACGNDQQPAPSHTTDTTVPAAPAPPTIVDLLSRAAPVTGASYDATSFEGPIAVYLVTRIGTQLTGGGENVDVSVLLAADRSAARLEIGRFSGTVPLPFGTVQSGPAFDARPYDAARDAYPAAPAWDEPSPVLRATALVTGYGETHAYTVVRRDDELVVYHTMNLLDRWRVGAIIALPPGAILTLPDAPPATASEDPTTVEIHERHETQWRSHVTSLRIGQRVGPLSDVVAHDDDHGSWTEHPHPDITDLPSGRIVASRRYDTYGIEARVLTRVGDELVMWRRGQEQNWVEEVRVPLPRGARLAFRALR